MIKSVTALLGGIISLSIIYYVSFWSAFDVNIFQHLAATDIIKGIAYPLRFGVLGIAVLFLVLLMVLIITIYKALVQNKGINKKKKFMQIRSIITGIIIIISGSIIFYRLYSDSVTVGLILSLLFLLVALDINAFVNQSLNDASFGNKEEAKKSKEELLVVVRQAMELPIIIFLIANALISGQVEANAIKSGKSFDYIVTKDLPPSILRTNEKYLVFLGSAGDKHFFIDKASNEHFMVDKTALQVIKSFHFERSSKDAQAVFERNTR